MAQEQLNEYLLENDIFLQEMNLMIISQKNTPLQKRKNDTHQQKKNNKTQWQRLRHN